MTARRVARKVARKVARSDTSGRTIETALSSQANAGMAGLGKEIRLSVENKLTTLFRTSHPRPNGCGPASGGFIVARYRRKDDAWCPVH